MNLVQLSYFIIVCEKGSISEASREHGVSQPCVTNALQELEKEYELPLFVRSKNHLTLTREGRELLRCAKSLCQSANKAKDLFRPEAGKKVIRIGIPGRLSGIISPILFAKFRKRCPEIDLEFFESPSKKVAEAILKEELDFGIVILKSELERGMESYEFCEVSMKLCVHRDNPLAGQGRITPGQIGSQPIISLQGGGFRNDFFAAKMREDGIEPNILLRTNQVVTMIEFIRRNLAAGFLFPENVAAFPEIVCVDTSWQQPAPVGIIWAESKKMNRAELLFLDYVRSFPWQ